MLPHLCPTYLRIAKKKQGLSESLLCINATYKQVYMYMCMIIMSDLFMKRMITLILL